MTSQEAPGAEPDTSDVKGVPAKPERLLRLTEVSRRVGLGKSMIYDLIGHGRFPAPYKISPYASRWSEQEIVAWIAEVKDGFEGKQRKFW